MKTKTIALVVIVLLVLGFGGCAVSRYNGFVQANEDIDAAWAQVQNVLQRRADLIPNLVETVKGYAAHETAIFTAVAEARAKLLGAKTPAEASAANAGLESALGRLLAISENYPNLKANESFVRLQDELAGTENRISVERKRYNDAVRAYNGSIKQFPGSLIAGMFGFSPREYFEAAPEAQQVPKVKF